MAKIRIKFILLGLLIVLKSSSQRIFFVLLAPLYSKQLTSQYFVLNRLRIDPEMPAKLMD